MFFTVMTKTLPKSAGEEKNVSYRKINIDIVIAMATISKPVQARY